MLRVSAVVISIQVELHGMVQLIAVTVLQTLQCRIRLGYPVSLCCVFTITMYVYIVVPSYHVWMIETNDE